MLPGLARRLFQVIFADDVVSIKNASRFVALIIIATRSGTPARTMSLTAVRRKSCSILTASPVSFRALSHALRESPDRFPVAVKYIRAKQSRGLARNFRYLAPFPLPLNRFQQFAVKDYQPALFVFGRAHF